MAYSNQRTVSDGSLRTILLAISFFDKTEITVFVNDVEQILEDGDYIWATSNSIQFPAALPSGDLVIIRRRTDISEMRHIFTEGAQFTNQTLDEDYTQMLHIAQESVEGSYTKELFNDLDMHQYRIRNLGTAVLEGDAVPLGQVRSIITNSGDLKRAVRAPSSEGNLPELPPAVSRANKVMGFNALGNPIAVLPLAGSGTELALDLANGVDPVRGAHMIGYFTRTVADRLGDFVSAKDHGATGDGVTNDSAAVQALIDSLSAAGGGTIYFPRGIYRLNIVLKKYVTLVGAGFGAARGMGVSGSVISRWNVTFLAAGPGFVVDTVAGAAPNGSIGMLGIDMVGLGASNPGGGVNIRTGNGNSNFRSMMFSGFADEAIVSVGLVGSFMDLMSTNCLLRRERTSRTGAFRIEGADNYIQNVEGNTGITGIVSPDLYLCGIYIGGANNYAINLMGELSEIGVFTTTAGAHHKIVNSRADLNFGHGYSGSSTMYSNCHAHNNSNGSSGVYSGFVSGGSNQYSGCRATGANGHKYGLDAATADFTDVSKRPNVDNFVSTGHIVAEIAYPTSNGMIVGQRAGLLRNNVAAGIIPVSGGVNTIQFSHVAESEITGFSGEYVGQTINISASGDFTVLVRSATFVVHGVDGAGKKRLVPGRTYTFVRGQTAWREVTDNYFIPMLATRPNLYASKGMLVFDTVLNKLIIRNEANSGWKDAATGATV